MKKVITSTVQCLFVSVLLIGCGSGEDVEKVPVTKSAKLTKLLLATAGKGDGIPAHTREEAERGDAIEQWIMGYYYAYGDGVPQDHKEAVKWYRKAAEQGLSNAQLCLGLQYAEGRGVPLNYKEAVKWYRKAAEQGIAKAQRNLGFAYYYGNGVPKDLVTAYAWYNVAAANSRLGAGKEASENRDLIAKEMKPDQIAEAQALSSKWFELYPSEPEWFEKYEQRRSKEAKTKE